MKTPFAALLVPAIHLLASSALATPATVTGPLGDPQLVRGKKLGMTYLHYGSAGADTSASVTVNYGFHGSPNASAPMTPTGYGNRVAFLDVPADATGFWYTLSVSDGSVQSNNGQPFALGVKDRAVSVTKASPNAATIVVKYAGPVTTTYDTYLHLGWNNWNAVGDAFMARTEFQYGKAGVYYDYNSVYLDPPWWANYLDFVVKDARNGGTWDNNGGADWHNSLKPFVTTSVYDQGNGTKYVTIGYADGSLSPVAVHYGIDGWQSPTTVNMNAVYGGYQVQIAVPSTAQEVELAFTNGSQWENNYGMNWTVSLQ